MAPRPTRSLLDRMARIALSRGLPEPDAEDVVVTAWQKAVAAWTPERGAFEALLARVVQRESVEWWRRARRQPVVEPGTVELVTAPPPVDLERIAENQRRLLDALSAEERRVFATWALQKHLPQGQLDAAGAAGRLGMSVADYNNAKRRLKDKIHRLANQWGLAPRAFFSVAEDEGPRRIGARHVG